MIEVNELSFSYPRLDVLKKVSFTIGSGKLITLLGPNGVGKSTLFKCILGLHKNYNGSIIINQENSKSMSPEIRSSWLAYIPQSHVTTFDYSVLEMVVMGTSNRISNFSTPRQSQYEIACHALEQMGLQDFSNRSFHKLSGGEQQLVLIARALAQQSKILIMDEPTSNLDFANQQRVMDHIKALTDIGYTVLLSNHNPQDAMLYSDQILALFNGKIIADGAPKDVLDQALMEKLYQTQVDIIAVNGEQIILPRSRRWLI